MCLSYREFEKLKFVYFLRCRSVFEFYVGNCLLPCYVVLTTDKAQNSMFFFCFFFYKTYYIQCILSEVDVENNNSDNTYSAIILSKEETVENKKYVLSSFGLFTKDDDCDLPSMYRIPKLHKNLYKTTLHSWICKNVQLNLLQNFKLPC